MNRITKYIVFIAIVASPFIYTVLTEYRMNSIIAVEEQTGIILPNATIVLKTDAQLFSLVDRDNYSWLIFSSSSLVPWAKSTGQYEGPKEIGGWSHTKTFQELSEFKNPRFNQLKLHSVWRFVKIQSDKEETSYLYIASDEVTAILETFRP